jgi:hypothetical protein
MAQPEVASTERVGLELAQKWRLDKHLDTDPALAADDDERVPSQKAVRSYVSAQDAPVTQPLQPSEAWPVGAVFIGVVATNPALLLGYGTWAAFGAGRVLVGLDSGDTDFDTAEETGGAKTKAISAHAGTAVADHANHTHTFVQSANWTGDLIAQDLTPAGVGAAGTTDGVDATLTHSVTQPNAHTDLNVVQPYIVVYMFKRTS